MTGEDEIIVRLRAEIDFLLRDRAASRVRRTETIAELRSIVTSLDSIVSAMKRLSINASIESARVGEMGKGFAVVATEFRTLATAAQTAVSQATGLLDTRNRDRDVE